MTARQYEGTPLVVVFDSELQLERLRRAAHEAPMNRIAQDHKGRRSLATHSMAWAAASRAYFAALEARTMTDKRQYEGTPLVSATVTTYFDDNRFVVETGWVGDEMSVALTRDGKFCFVIDEPWQGDTETGFGAKTSVDIDVATATQLRDWLANAIARATGAA